LRRSKLARAAAGDDDEARTRRHVTRELYRGVVNAGMISALANAGAATAAGQTNRATSRPMQTDVPIEIAILLLKETHDP
jgi:hypothetical protein